MGAMGFGRRKAGLEPAILRSTERFKRDSSRARSRDRHAGPHGEPGYLRRPRLRSDQRHDGRSRRLRQPRRRDGCRCNDHFERERNGCWASSRSHYVELEAETRYAADKTGASSRNHRVESEAGSLGVDKVRARDWACRRNEKVGVPSSFLKLSSQFSSLRMC